MADITYYVAMPFLQDDVGSLVPGAAEECQSPTTALLRAAMLSKTAGHIGAVAFSRSGDPMTGEFGDAKVRPRAGRSRRAVTGRLRPLSRAGAAPCVHTSRCRLPPAPGLHRHADRGWPHPLMPPPSHCGGRTQS